MAAAFDIFYEVYAVYCQLSRCVVDRPERVKLSRFALCNGSRRERSFPPLRRIKINWYNWNFTHFKYTRKGGISLCNICVIVAKKCEELCKVAIYVLFQKFTRNAENVWMCVKSLSSKNVLVYFKYITRKKYWYHINQIVNLPSHWMIKCWIRDLIISCNARYCMVSLGMVNMKVNVRLSLCLIN
jgi:hypothetical protein